MPISRTTSSRSGQARVAPNLQDLLIVLAGKLIGQWLTGVRPSRRARQSRNNERIFDRDLQPDAKRDAD